MVGVKTINTRGLKVLVSNFQNIKHEGKSERTTTEISWEWQ